MLLKPLFGVCYSYRDLVSWAEAEERRRVWWAVILLDRYVWLINRSTLFSPITYPIRYINIGGGNRPFACNDAKLDDLLPMDEESWDKGVRLS